MQPFLKFAPGISATLGALASFLLCLPALNAADITVTIENLAPANGTFLTPLFVGFHDGSFDLFNPGGTASAGLERLAEDGLTEPLATEFLTSGAGTVSGVIMSPMGPIAPGATFSMTFSLDPLAASSRFMSFASMVIPSNDAFIGNEAPSFLSVFDATGNFLGGSIVIAGSQVWDAGTEVNDETSMNTAFFGQANPNTGTTENGTVQIHPGFGPAGSGGILDGSFMGNSFANADFKAPGYEIARIIVVPEPGVFSFLALGVFLLGGRLFRILQRSAGDCMA